MPCSRILLRLEIRDDKNLVDFSYCAPDSLTEEADERLSSINLTRKDLKLLNKAESDTLRGQRNYHSITIETYLIEGMSEGADGEKSEPHSSSETAKVNEGGIVEKTIPRNSELCILTTAKMPKLKMDKKSSIDDETGHLSHVVRFLSGNPAVETTEGFLHLYKEQPPFNDKSPVSHMLCMLSIPATFCLQDLLKFLGPVISDLEMIKVVKPGTPNEYMALLKFRTLSCAHEFFETCNNKKFNSIEPDICHLAFVAKIDCIRSQEGAGEALSNAVELPVCAV